MRIQKLRVKNFRGFAEREFEFADHFNVLVGNNGCGKSAILEALAVALGALVRGLDQLYLRRHLDEGGERGLSPVYGIRPPDVRQRRFTTRGVTHVEPQFPSVVDCEAIFDGAPVTWSRRAELDVEAGFTNVLSPGELSSLLGDLREVAQTGSHGALPLAVYYGTQRLCIARATQVETRSPGSRLDAYADCLEPTIDESQLIQWLKTMEIAAVQRGVSPESLLAVKSALEDCVLGWTDFYFDVEQDQLVATEANGEQLAVSLMSDGVRTTAVLVGDLARRTAELNPHLGKDAARLTPGVVLIDELDLHLHPGWQRRVVNDLRRTFPLIQFICTTHSPFIIQQLRSGELIDLNELHGKEYQDKSIEDITENVMGVPLPQISHRRQAMLSAAEEYYRVLQSANGASTEEKERLKRRLDDLVAPFSDDPAYHAFLKMERTVAGLGG
ncbi:AAA family ATPase [Planctomycetota bacterium]|nr:AAA family ATPase [Planctomycetota bacterium]